MFSFIFNKFFSFTSQLDVSFLYVNGDVVSANGYKVATSEYTYLGDFTVQDVGGSANSIDLSAHASSGYDVVVVGTGIAGLYTALLLPM